MIPECFHKMVTSLNRGCKVNYMFVGCVVLCIHSESTWILVERLTQQAVEGVVKADKLLEEAKAQRRLVDVSVQTQVSRLSGCSLDFILIAFTSFIF